MRLRLIAKTDGLAEARWVRVLGGADSTEPDYVYPWSHSHEIIEAPDQWFHGTTDARLEAIRANGLNNSKNYLTRQRSLAAFSANRAAKRFGGNPIILTISLGNLDIEIAGTGTDSATTSPIPPSAITKISKGRRDMPGLSLYSPHPDRLIQIVRQYTAANLPDWQDIDDMEDVEIAEFIRDCRTPQEAIQAVQRVVDTLWEKRSEHQTPASSPQWDGGQYRRPGTDNDPDPDSLYREGVTRRKPLCEEVAADVVALVAKHLAD